jgi:hypothetical protein
VPVAIVEDMLPSGWRAIRLANDHVEVILLPDKGSEIYALRSLRHEVDLLWKAPWGLRPPPVPSSAGDASAAVWLDYYAGGWQELFPNGGAACEYAGTPHTFHGEASVVPWQYSLVDRDGAPAIRLEVRLARTPFRIQKEVWLDPQRPVLHQWERITNEGVEALPFMWGHHPAYGAPFLDGGCRLDAPAATFLAHDPQMSAHTSLAPGVRSRWPLASRPNGEAVDMSRIPGPQERVANLGYLLDFAEGWYALSNERLGLGIGLAWPEDIFPYVWLWQELHGSRGYPWHGAVYVMGVEPHTSYPGSGLVAAIEQGTAPRLDAGASLEATITAALFEPRGRVRRVTPEGDVEFEEE